jgi:hypothetical protein
MSDKNDFYPRVKTSLVAAGYEYFDGDRDVKGKTRQHKRKPDYIAVKGNEIIIGEIKSPNELPTSSSWRKKQPNDSHEFARVREDVRNRERAGKVNPYVGGHEIIIRGQIPDYVSNVGITYDLPIENSKGMIRCGYSVPSEQAENVECAFKNCRKDIVEVLNDRSYATTFIFEL